MEPKSSLWYKKHSLGLEFLWTVHFASWNDCKAYILDLNFSDSRRVKSANLGLNTYIHPHWYFVKRPLQVALRPDDFGCHKKTSGIILARYSTTLFGRVELSFKSSSQFFRPFQIRALVVPELFHLNQRVAVWVIAGLSKVVTHLINLCLRKIIWGNEPGICSCLKMAPREIFKTQSSILLKSTLNSFGFSHCSEQLVNSLSTIKQIILCWQKETNSPSKPWLLIKNLTGLGLVKLKDTI